MKTCYSKILSPVRLAVLDVSPAYGGDGMDPNGYIINRVNTPRDFRGKGHAQELMRRCLADADAKGITLYLWINAYGDMSTEQLDAWFKRLGFVVSDGLYSRTPILYETSKI